MKHPAFALPTAVDRLGACALQDAAAGHAFERVGRLPGVSITEPGQGTTAGQPSCRGFNGEGEVNPVKLPIDGVPSNGHDGHDGHSPGPDLLFPLEVATLPTVRGTHGACFGLHANAGGIDSATQVLQAPAGPRSLDVAPKGSC